MHDRLSQPAGGLNGFGCIGANDLLWWLPLLRRFFGVDVCPIAVNQSSRDGGVNCTRGLTEIWLEDQSLVLNGFRIQKSAE